IVPLDKVGTEPEKKILSISPNVDGNLTWEDQYTLKFEPKEPWESGKTYQASVDVATAYPNMNGIKDFNFNFDVLKQDLAVSIASIDRSKSGNYSSFTVRGMVNSADEISQEELAKILNASYMRTDKHIVFEQSNSKNQYFFNIYDIERTNSDQVLKITYDGSRINIDRKGELKVDIPALGKFVLLDSRVTQDDNQIVDLFFSEPIDPNQNLDGLINILGYNGTFTKTIEENKIKLFLKEHLDGLHKINLDANIRTESGQTLSKNVEWTCDFKSLKPQVRAIGNGVILPSTEGLRFPFEAINLKAIDVEIFKIYNNNIIQLLQVNELNGTYDLERIGDIILQKTITLNSGNPNDWTRFAIDLDKLIKIDPNALYQVRIGFRPHYAALTCTNSNINDTKIATNELTLVNRDSLELDENGEVKSLFGNYYGYEGYFEGYDWQNQDDPCFREYYNQDKFLTKNVYASNIGITAKYSKNGILNVAVADIRDVKPLSGTKLTVYDAKNQIIGNGTTDSNGFAEITPKKKPFIVLAENNNEKGYLKLDDGASLSMSRFDVAGSEVQKGLKGFIYGDRGVWRPGDSLFLNFMLFDKSNTLPQNYPISYELIDPRGQVFRQSATINNINRLYPISLATPATAPVGNWTMKVKVGGATFSKNIKIETIKPNHFKIALDLGKDRLRTTNDAIVGTANVSWLTGALASSVKLKIDLSLRNIETKFKKYPSYKFDDPTTKSATMNSVIFDGKVDDNGNATINTAQSALKSAAGKMQAQIETRAFEPSGDFSTDYQTLEYSPFSNYVGIDLPSKNGGENRIELNQGGTVKLVSVDNNGNAIANRKLQVSLYKLIWRWWWEDEYDNFAQFNTSEHLAALDSKQLVTNSKGEVDWKINISDWGRYMIRVCDLESGHCSGDFLYTGYPWGDNENEYKREAAAMLELSSQKTTYNIGENIQVKIPVSTHGKALVSIENGNGVIKKEWVSTNVGNNIYSFKATPEMSPNIYVNVSLIQPHNKFKSDLPLRLYGILPITVEDKNAHLTPVIIANDELKPDQEFNIDVKEKSGSEMSYTLVIVDEGLLDLTRFETPDPWKAFNAKEAIGTKSWDLYDDVMGTYGSTIEKILSIGGDAEIAKNRGKANNNRFKPVVLNYGPFKLEKGKSNRHKIKMPNYIGSVRAMVVACNDKAQGAAEKTMKVKKPLMVLTTIPRVLGVAETIDIPINVFALDNKIKNVQVKIEEISKLANIVDEKSKTLNFARIGDAIIPFKAQIGNQTGTAKFKITATSAGEIATEIVEVYIRNPNPIINEVQSSIINQNKTWTVQNKFDNPTEHWLEVSSFPSLNLGSRLNFLIQYPYGCLEQTVSSVFPQLYISDLQNITPSEKQRIDLNIRAAIDKLKLFQTSLGGFAYWPGSDSDDPWATSYAGHFLLEAQRKGYNVPNAVIDRWKVNQKKRSSNYKKTENYFDQDLVQSYRLYTLALARSADWPSMNKLKENKQISTIARWSLASAYAISGKKEVALEIIKNLNTSIKPYQELSYTYGSDLRDMSLIMETQLLVGNRAGAFSIGKNISSKLNSQSWFNTQTTAYCLMSLSKLALNSDATLKFAYQLGDGKWINIDSKKPLVQIKVPSSNKNKNFEIKNLNSNPIYATNTAQGQPNNQNILDASNDLAMSIVYKDMNGKPLKVTSLKQGTDFICEVKVSNTGNRGVDYKELALSNIFPSGWEILQSKYDDNIIGYNSAFDFQEKRDDRILTFFDLSIGESKIYRFKLNATYLGKYYLPPAYCEAMYDNTINSRKSSSWVSVVK
ncbi:MAG: hypothetical protein KBA06_04495, partial [Saprospiraceae bacterium]|nr:hypothetical protein [Saprospiraceae bacterium]